MWRSLEKQDRGAKQREQSTAIQGAKISHDRIQGAKIHFKVRNSKSKISHTTIQGAKIFAPCETPSWHTSVISHCLSQFSHSANQGAKISHTSIQGVKFIPTCENHSPRCEFSKRQFRTPLFKVRKFSHCAKHPPGTRVAFRTSQANFRTVRNKVQKFRTMRN